MKPRALLTFMALGRGKWANLFRGWPDIEKAK